MTVSAETGRFTRCRPNSGETQHPHEHVVRRVPIISLTHYRKGMLMRLVAVLILLPLVLSSGCGAGTTDASSAAAPGASDDWKKPTIRRGQPIPREFIDKDNVAAVRYCLDQGAGLDVQVDLGGTAFHIAIAMRANGVVDLLLERGVDINQVSKSGETPLKSCVLTRNKSLAKRLLDLGADVDAQSMATAAHMGYDDWVTLFLDRGVDVNRRDRWGNTALHRACRTKRASTVKLLLERGAEPDLATPDNRAPLIEAATSGCLECVELLITHDADVNRATKSYGETPLIVAVQSRRAAVVKFLLLKGAKRNAKDREGATALDHSRRNKDSEIADLLK